MELDVPIHPPVFARVAYRAMECNFEGAEHELFTSRYAGLVADGTLPPVDELFTMPKITLGQWTSVLQIGLDCWGDRYPLLLMEETGIEAMGIGAAYVCLSPNMRSTISGFSLHYSGIDVNLRVNIVCARGGIHFTVLYPSLRGWIGACFNATAASLFRKALESVSGLKPGDGHQFTFYCNRPSSGHLYEEFMGCPVEWTPRDDGQLGISCFIPDHVLDRPNPMHDEVLYNGLSNLMWEDTTALAEMREVSSTWTSMTRLRLSSSTVMPTQQKIADGLHITTRTLQKHLKEEGTSWHELADEEFINRSKMMLRSGDTVEVIASALGMTAGNFRRKFKGATGQTSSAWLAAEQKTT